LSDLFPGATVQVSSPRHDHVDVAIVGAGFGGLCAAIRLQEAGRSFLVLEKGEEVGGTWRDNTYPGAACDVQSHLYSFSFEGKPDWSQRYAGWREIEDYILAVTERHGLRRRIRFGAEVVAARFDERTARWTVRTRSGDEVVARFVILATGPLHVPAIPDLPGLDRFEGRVFHSARWDHGYDLTDKVVASIGTGGSAIQYVPAIAPVVRKLHVFQRTPAWVIPRDERTYTEAEKQRFAASPARRRLHRAQLYWTNEARVWPMFAPRLARGVSKLVAASIRRQVRDRATARRLTPDYALGCKRILISNTWYPTFNRDNVELVTDAIREIRARSIVTADGVERPVDAIVLGTGFVVDPRKYMRDFEITGLAGRHLADDWKDWPQAYFGITVAGFPNWFQLVGPNTGLGHNSIVFMIEAQVHYVLRCLDLLAERGGDWLSVKPEVQQAFNDDLQRNLASTVWARGGCRSWYTTEDGKNITLWPWSTWRYWLRTRRPDPRAYVIGKATGQPHDLGAR
jgi:cation diffusion facilitator CzcD-associated flavoprotein CzcO